MSMLFQYIYAFPVPTPTTLGVAAGFPGSIQASPHVINYVGNADSDSFSPSLLVNVYDYMSGGHIEPGTVVTK